MAWNILLVAKKGAHAMIRAPGSMSLVLRTVGVAVLVAFLMLLDAPAARAALTDQDGDGFADVAESVFGSDPGNPASTPETVGFPALFFPTDVCADGLDNDADGLTDAADPSCGDSDDDLFSDPLETLLGSDPNDFESIPEDYRFDAMLISFGLPIRLCFDGMDDDLDGLTDAADPGCDALDTDGDTFDDLAEKIVGSDPADTASVPEHETFNPGSCTDGSDNDLDGLIDGADGSCVVTTNDDFADATVVPGLPFSDTTKILGAGVEPGEAQPSCLVGFGVAGHEVLALANSIWYRFSPGEDVLVIADTTGSGFNPVVAVWTETVFGLEEIACHNSFNFGPFTAGPRFSFQAAAGTTYLIQVGADPGFFLGAGDLVFGLEAGVPPANDDFADATTIPGVPFSDSVETLAATTEPNEPAPTCSFVVADTVWYRFSPPTDMVVMADTEGTDFLFATIGVYQGGSLSDLTQVACSLPFFGTSALAFEARAGETYFLQAGGIDFDAFEETEPAGMLTRRLTQELGKEGAGGFGLPPSSGTLVLNLETFAIPPCPASQFSIEDPLGDTFGFGQPQHDIVSVAGGFDAESLCLTVEFADALDPAGLAAFMDFDTDADRNTGFDSELDYSCPGLSGLGVETSAFFLGDAGLLVTFGSFFGVLPTSPDFGAVLFSDTSFTLILPLAALGGDGMLNFGMSVANLGGPTDCLPDGGSISCSGGSCAFAPFRNGDANCDRVTNSVDAAIVLQFEAVLITSVACPAAADVDGNGFPNSLDAVLILQFVAGLIEELPPCSRCEVPLPLTGS